MTDPQWRMLARFMYWVIYLLRRREGSSVNPTAENFEFELDRLREQAEKP